MNKIYAINNFNLTSSIVKKKRQEMCNLINDYLDKYEILDALDIGTTNDFDFKFSNYLIKNLKNISIYKSISDQKITDNFFSKILQKSIRDDFTFDEIDRMKSDLVLSNATIEHVGSFTNQIKMINNMINLSKKFFIITTPNRFHPIEFHTKIPFLHWLPKIFYRKILKSVNLNYFAKEENLNLLAEKDIRLAFKTIGFQNYKIFKIYLFGLVSNFVIIGKI